MTRTLPPEDLTAHLTDGQRATIRAGGHAAQRIRDAVAAELPAIVRATYIAETDHDGEE